MITNMADGKFLGVKRETLTLVGVILAPTLTTLIIVAALFNAMNSNINSSVNRLDAAIRANGDAIAATNAAIADVAAQTAANGAAIEALISVTRETNDDLDALTADVVELKVETAEIKGKLENIEFRVTNIETRVTNIENGLPDYESVDNRLESLERGQADLRTRVDAIAAAE